MRLETDHLAFQWASTIHHCIPNIHILAGPVRCHLGRTIQHLVQWVKRRYHFHGVWLHQQVQQCQRIHFQLKLDFHSIRWQHWTAHWQFKRQQRLKHHGINWASHILDCQHNLLLLIQPRLVHTQPLPCTGSCFYIFILFFWYWFTQDSVKTRDSSYPIVLFRQTLVEKIKIWFAVFKIHTNIIHSV